MININDIIKIDEKKRQIKKEIYSSTNQKESRILLKLLNE